MMTDTSNPNPPDLAKEQKDLLAIMEAAIDPQLLAAVNHAYRGTDVEHPVMLDISYEGTINA
ncbi:MAG: hypothetical protein IPP35_08085 [Elusimicrobia bacterium]|nr:hypothetical protein [Elusimicrobiota bacterium]